MKNAKCEEEDEGRRVENEGEKAKENAKRANESVNDWIFLSVLWEFFWDFFSSPIAECGEGDFAANLGGFFSPKQK